MRRRDNSPQAKRASAVTTAAGAVVRVGESETSGRKGSKYRTKRPPPLPTRKAHKIKRVKAQRSAPWAALEPVSSPGRSSSATLPRTAPMGEHMASVGEVLGAEGAQAPAEVQQALAAGQDPNDRRWFLLLKVGRDELAGIWDGSLESCEPIVWRPATNSWAPLFEVPQIATLVSATVKQRQAEAATRASKVPASPAPRRRYPSGVALARGQSRASIPPGQLRLAGHGSSPPPAEGRGDSTKPSSLAELGGRQSGNTARLPVRSPYIPPPPRVPQVHPAFDFEEDSATVPAFALAPRKPDESEERIIPLTERREERGATQGQQWPPSPVAQLPPARVQALPVRAQPSVQAPLPSRAPLPIQVQPKTVPADSYAPHARTLAPPAFEASAGAPRTPAVERAGWLLGGIAAALMLTTFTGLGSSMHAGLVNLTGPEPGQTLAATLDVKPTQDQSSSDRENSQKSKAGSSEQDGDVLSVEELPVLGKDGKLRRTRSESEDDDGDGKRRAAAASKSVAVAAVSPKRETSQASAVQPTPVTRRAAKPPPKPQSVGFNAGAARRALHTSVGKAQFCAAERATGSVIVTFAPSGGVTGVSLASLDGKDVRKGCVIRAFRGARVSPFQGDPVTVQKSFRLR